MAGMKCGGRVFLSVNPYVVLILILKCCSEQFLKTKYVMETSTNNDVNECQIKEYIKKCSSYSNSFVNLGIGSLFHPLNCARILIQVGCMFLKIVYPDFLSKKFSWVMNLWHLSAVTHIGFSVGTFTSCQMLLNIVSSMM